MLARLNGSSVCSPSRVIILRKSDHTYFTENLLHYIYIVKNFNESTTVCSLALNYFGAVSLVTMPLCSNGDLQHVVHVNIWNLPGPDLLLPLTIEKYNASFFFYVSLFWLCVILKCKCLFVG